MRARSGEGGAPHSNWQTAGGTATRTWAREALATMNATGVVLDCSTQMAPDLSTSPWRSVARFLAAVVGHVHRGHRTEARVDFRPARSTDG